MRWLNNMIQNNALNDSKLSHRSQSKFKKVNLQKNLQENHKSVLEKSLLKLSSVEKFQQTSTNNSRIAEFKDVSQSFLDQSRCNCKQNKDYSASQFGNITDEKNIK